MLYQLKPSADVGSEIIVPSFAVACVPRIVPDVEGVDLTLSVPAVTVTRSPAWNLAASLYSQVFGYPYAGSPKIELSQNTPLVYVPVK